MLLLHADVYTIFSLVSFGATEQLGLYRRLIQLVMKNECHERMKGRKIFILGQQKLNDWVILGKVKWVQSTGMTLPH